MSTPQGQGKGDRLFDKSLAYPQKYIKKNAFINALS
jgi:hypothetical protein